MMKLFGYSTRLDSEETTDKTHLLTHHATSADDRLSDDNNESDYDDEEEEEEEDHEDKPSEHEQAFMCEKCQRRAKETTDTRGDCDVRMCTVSSADVIDVCVVTDEGRESKEKKKKKKKKPLKKRVRKGVWRAMRSSWKYLRRGMSGYAPGLAAIFTWGVNFNQAVPVRTSGRSRY